MKELSKINKKNKDMHHDLQVGKELNPKVASVDNNGDNNCGVA